MQSSEAALAGLFALDPVAHGAWLYHAFCYRCHGDYAEVRLGEQNAPERVLELMTAGTVDMAAVSQGAGGPLTDDEIDAAAAYIARWEALGAEPPVPLALAETIAAIWPERVEPPVASSGTTGDRTRGAVLYIEHCAVCHGAAGEGGTGAVLAKEWMVDWPDRTVRRTITHGIPRSAMIAWSQARGGPLTVQEIEDLTVHVLSLGPTGMPPAAPATVAAQEEITAAEPLSTGERITVALNVSPTLALSTTAQSAPQVTAAVSPMQPSPQPSAAYDVADNDATRTGMPVPLVLGVALLGIVALVGAVVFSIRRNGA